MEKTLNKRGFSTLFFSFCSYIFLIGKWRNRLLDVSNSDAANIFSSKVSQLFRFSSAKCFFINVYLKASRADRKWVPLFLLHLRSTEKSAEVTLGENLPFEVALGKKKKRLEAKIY